VIFDGAQWIWAAAGDSVNSYVSVRHEFSLTSPDADAELRISADSDYAVWVNGEFVDSGQYNDFPQHKAYDVLPVGRFLRAGSNALCVRAYHQGTSSFRYRQGSPGLIYSLRAGDALVLSGAEAWARADGGYVSGPVPMVSRQIGYSFEYDAGGDDDWRSADFTPTEWAPAAVDIARNDEPVEWYRRPIRKLRRLDRATARVRTQGALLRRGAPAGARVAQLVHTDFLSTRPAEEILPGAEDLTLPNPGGIRIQASDGADGVYLLLDLGREECGVLDLDLDSRAGVVIDVGWGQHLDDLRVRSAVGDRSFAARYVTRAGRQQFTHHFRRLSGRWLQLHILEPGEDFTLYYAGLIPTEYPLRQAGSLRGLGRLEAEIERTARRTLALCMHEHYEDTPWREQALYAMDSRNQALCGYYCFGEYDFPASSFALLGESLREDGFLDICAPAENNRTIPGFTFHWVAEVAEHLLFSGQIEAARARLPQVRRVLDTHMAALSDGLLPTPAGPYWNFYDWAPGMNGSLRPGSPSGEYDAPLNLLFALALDSGAFLEEETGDPAAAERYRSGSAAVKQAAHAAFWDAQARAYQTYVGPHAGDHHAELTQALALTVGACPPDLAPDLRRRIADSAGLVPVTLSQTLVKFQALLAEPDVYGGWVADRIAQDWGHQLFNGATSFWETIAGADDFSRAGSLCHGWSAVPAYFYYAHFLGVRPVRPGFATFVVDPLPLRRIGGVVPTPHGDIELSVDGGVSAPPETVQEAR
jgi:hypothetical protein